MIRCTYIAALTMTALVGSGVAMALPGENLLVNGNAEQGNTEPWRLKAGANVKAVQSRVQSSGTVEPKQGDFLFSMAGADDDTNPGTDPSKMKQDVKVKGYGGAQFVFKGWVQTEEDVVDDGAEPDFGRAVVKFLDRDGKLVERFMTERLRATDDWEKFSVSGQIPENAKWARVILKGRLRDGQFINVFWDKVSFRHDALIDIKPGSDPNSINLCSRGVVPVALLGNKGFEPQEDVDLDHILFAGAEPKRCTFEDVYPHDGHDDLLCHFPTQELELEGDDTYACLEARLNNERLTQFEGCDSVRIVKSRDRCPPKSHRE